MTSVTTYNKTAIDAFIAAGIVSGSIDSNGHLILTAEGGSTLDLGVVKPPPRTGTFATDTNTTTSTVIGTWLIPGTVAAALSRFRLVAAALVSSAASSPGTLQILIQVNGQTLASFPTVSLATALASEELGIEATLIFKTVGSTGAAHGKGQLTTDRIQASAPSGTTASRKMTLDTTGNLSLVVIATFSVANSANSITIDTGVVTQEN